MTLEHPIRAETSSRERVTRWWPLIATLAGFVVVSVLVLPRMDSTGTAGVTTFNLDRGQPIPGARTSGTIVRNAYGFTVDPYGSGSASFTISTPPAPVGAHTVLAVTAGGGDDLSNTLSVVGAGGRLRVLGHPVRWTARRVDITRFVRRGRTRLVFQATNAGPAAQLIADQVRVISYPPSAVPDAGRWEVALWVGLAIVLVLVALRRLRRDAPAAVAAALTAFLVWPAVVSGVWTPLQSDLWRPAVHAGWVDLDTGLLSGSFPRLSSLAVQLFHAVTPITGTGETGARTASMLIGVLAVLAVYALGRRVVGLHGAVTAAACLLLADSFRLSLSSGTNTGTLVLAATLFLIAVYEVLRRGNRASMIALGVAGAIAIVAEPLWWPAVVAALLWLGLREIPSGARRRALAAGFLALVLVALPNRVSVADQSNGDANADVVRLSTVARNNEFVGHGHGAPPSPAALAADPRRGPQVGMADYVLGDHSLSVVAGGVLSGAYHGLAAADRHTQTKLIGVLAFVLELAGVLVLLMIPRLRLLAVMPALLAAIPWFYADRGAMPNLTAVAGFWPALLVGAAAVVHMAVVFATERSLARGPRRPFRARAGALAERIRWRTQPSGR